MHNKHYQDYRDWKMKNDFSSVGEIINDTLSKNPRYKFAIKCSTLFSFWEQIVGQKFAKFSKPVALNYNKLSVACKNPVVAQELTMFKADLLLKIEKYSSPLNLKVSDLIFTYKNWGDEPEIPDEIGEDDRFIQFSEEQLSQVEISHDELSQIRENINLMPLDTALKEKYFKNIVDSIRAGRLRG